MLYNALIMTTRLHKTSAAARCRSLFFAVFIFSSLPLLLNSQNMPWHWWAVNPGAPYLTLQLQASEQGREGTGILDLSDGRSAPVSWQQKVYGYDDAREWNLQLEGQDLRLIVSREESGDAVLREYLMYRLYNQLSKLSPRVRLVRLSTGNGKQKQMRWGYLVESPEMLARRSDAIPFDFINVPPAKLAPVHRDMLGCYQQMTGNKGWSISLLDEIRLIRFPNGDLAPVPTGFSRSEWLPLIAGTADFDTETWEPDASALLATLRYFRHKRDDLYQTVVAFEWLDEAAKLHIFSKMDHFFQEADAYLNGKAQAYWPLPKGSAVPAFLPAADQPIKNSVNSFDASK